MDIQEKTNEIIEYFSEDLNGDGADYRHYRKKIVTTMAYLIGVYDSKFQLDGVFDTAEYEKLKSDKYANIIKHLCRLRTQFLRNYKNIDEARKYDMRFLESLTEYLDMDSMKYLRNNGIEINIPNAKSPAVNVAYINQYILDNIDSIKHLIPDWVKFRYIKPLFLMPGGYAGHYGSELKNSYEKINKCIVNFANQYYTNRLSYPYQMYIAWPVEFREGDGNILYNDLKFLKMLYGAHHDKFQADRYVVDAKAEKKERIYDFIERANNVAIFVDCENVDPYAFGATILNLDANQLSKIKKIILYDDVNTSTAWDYITDIMAIPVVKKDIERVVNNKSLVDITMTAGVCEEYYRNDMESIILASSDSDFWGLIKQLPNARFCVLNEYNKTSAAVIEQMDIYNIKHCFMSDFAQDKIQKFKSDVLYLGLLQRIKKFNKTGEFGVLDVDTLIDELFFDACIIGAEGQIKREKEAFFNKYLKHGLLLKPVNDNGKITLKIELYKK